MKNQSKSGEGTPEKQPPSGAFPVALGSAIGPFEVYEDYDDMLHIIDGNTRVMLSDSYAYDGNAQQTEARMRWIRDALNAAWQAQPNKPDSATKERSD